MKAKLIIILILFFYTKQTKCEEEDLCIGHSCYPATGNLLIGRKNQLSVTSTCGLKQIEKYCIVSNLVGNSSCYQCDSRRPNVNNHRIENVIKEKNENKYQRWWQAENGKENVSIRLDLEAEFHFTHLIMTFKNFRPSAMLIERSSDYGKKWEVYRYFAYDCANSFPKIREIVPKNHGDVVCTDRYSSISPSNGGELIYKVVNPQIPTINPYAEEVAKLLRITNLRINFTKLHTLGDDLLDHRQDIKKKYYYGLYELIIRGSCSCYGHAQKCIPMDNNINNVRYYNYQDQVPDMVYGKCLCTHNTKGLNCEFCDDFFNDLPWKPGFGNETNECKRCECNNHARSCHFDEGVYINSGNTSGGVCDDCQHNTMGIHCEVCKPYFYKDVNLPFNSPHACKACSCDIRGSLYNGICESENDEERNLISGKCYCKRFVDGNDCSYCKDGFWNLNENNDDGCEECSCNILGTINNEGCNKETGECICKRFVTGDKCNSCVENYYGLSEDLDGCKDCDCDIGGSLSSQCDNVTGQCICKKHFTGRRCDIPEDSFYCPNLDFYTFEGEDSVRSGKESIIEYREKKSKNYFQKWSGTGYVRVKEGSELNFMIGRVYKTLLYNIIIRYDSERNSIGWENVEIILSRPNIINNENIGSCKGYNVDNDYMIIRLEGNKKYKEITPSICLEEGIDYQLKIIFREKITNYNDRSASILIDSIIITPPLDELEIFNNMETGRYHLDRYTINYCRHLILLLTSVNDLPTICQKYTCSIAGSMIDKGIQCDCDKTGSVSALCNIYGGECSCKKNVIGRRCDKCDVGTYGFSPNGCLPCECDSVGALDNICDRESGQCLCNKNEITGRQCNECYEGSWNFPNCQLCSCNGHTEICDQKNGTCLSCNENTKGYNCERCRDGYYGDPRIEVNIPCKPCMCPGGPDSGNYNAKSCSFNYISGGTLALCHCKKGYVGNTCDECDINYWGNPKEVGGSCEKCECSGNVDPNVEGNCDKNTGECMKCLYHTTGINCELCDDGFFGNGAERSCEPCACNKLGSISDVCDKNTGSCSCLPNVVGDKCNSCAENHYNLNSGKGCLKCECDPNGVVLDDKGEPILSCDLSNGQCQCKEGRGGKKCSECKNYFWGNPSLNDCTECNCNRIGSSSAQCNKDNGSCECRTGYGNVTCDSCAYGYKGQFPYCESCGECFTNWDEILKNLNNEVDNLIRKGKNIEDKGVPSFYDKQFNIMESKLDDIKKMLNKNKITEEELYKLSHGAILFDEKIQKLSQRSSGAKHLVENLSKSRDSVEEFVDMLKENLSLLKEDINDFVDKSESLKETNIMYAYNSTVESYRKSINASRKVNESLYIFNQGDEMQYEVQDLLRIHKNDFDKLFIENNAALILIKNKYKKLKENSYKLNKLICGGMSETFECDVLCGGPTNVCPFCGGEACKNGAVPNAVEAINFGNEAIEKLKQLEDITEKKMYELNILQNIVNKTHRDVDKVINLLNKTKNEYYDAGVVSDDIMEKIDEFLNKDRISMENISNIINEIDKMKIDIDRDEIYKLTVNLFSTVRTIPNVDEISREAIKNKTRAYEIMEKARNSLKLSKGVLNDSRNAQDIIKNVMENIINIQSTINNFSNNIIEGRNNFYSGDRIAKKIDEELNEIKKYYNSLNKKFIDIKVNELKSNTTMENAIDKDLKTQEIIKSIKVTAFDLKNDIVKGYKVIEEKSRYGCGYLLERAIPLRERAINFIEKASTVEDEIRELENIIFDSEKDIESMMNEIDKETSIIDKNIEEYLYIEEHYENCDF